MNNKGFAITGIIYTLFVLFLMILLSVLSGLTSYQRLMINSTKTLEPSFEGTKITNISDVVDNNGVTKYSGKYVFKNGNTMCTAYLETGTKLQNATISFVEGTCSFSVSKDNINKDSTYIFGMEN